MTLYKAYLLQAFDEANELKVNQLIHILQGKRTPYILHLTELYRAEHLFNLFPKVSLKQLEHDLRVFVRNGELVSKNEGFILGASGSAYLASFSEKCPTFPAVTSLRYVNLRSLFFTQWQFLTQVYSNWSHANTRFYPLIKNYRLQQQIKHYLAHSPLKKTEQIKQWTEELTGVFSHLSQKQADFLASHLSGYHLAGQAVEQICRDWGLDRYSYVVAASEITELMLQQVVLSEQLPEHRRLAKTLDKITRQGLSSSAFQTSLLLEKGLSFASIAGERRLKENTIREHVLEIATVRPEFNWQLYLQNPNVNELIQVIQSVGSEGYQAVLKEIPDLPFMDYRLVERALRRGEWDDA